MGQIIKNGLTFNFRDDTYDRAIIKSINNEYKLFDLKPNDIVLDIGGNIGTFVVYNSKKVKEIYSFEPEIENYNLMLQNIEANNIKNCKVYYFAVVGNDDNERKFYLNQKTNKGSHSFNVKRGRKEITVKCLNINDVLNLNKFNKIKIDIEGAEYEVIKAIKSFDRIESMVIEFHFSMLKDKTHDKFNEILNLLGSNFKTVIHKNPSMKTWTTIIYCKKE